MKNKIKINILDNISNISFEYELDLIKNDIDLIEYELENSLYSIKISKDTLFFSSKGIMNYNFILKEKETVASFLKNEEYIFKVYVYTEKLKIENDEIFVSYKLFSDENLKDTISSYNIVFKRI